MFTITLETPLGPAAAASARGALTGFWFLGQRYFPKDFPAWQSAPDAEPFGPLLRWLSAYFAGENPSVPFPLAPCGTPFQQAVWALLIAVPYGQTVTYGALANAYAEKTGGRPTSARAVGNAVGHNPISLLIPCHRVIGAGGALTGYAGGVEKKAALLRLEGAGKEALK